MSPLMARGRVCVWVFVQMFESADFKEFPHLLIPLYVRTHTFVVVTVTNPSFIFNFKLKTCCQNLLLWTQEFAKIYLESLYLEWGSATSTFQAITVISQASKHIICQIKADFQVGLGLLSLVKPLSTQC